MPSSVDDYLAGLPEDRRSALQAVRRVVRANLPRGFEEGMVYGMIGWYVPLADYPETYNGQPLSIAALASQKGYMSLYLLGVYGDDKVKRWFVDAYKQSGKKLDMGKSCVRFKSVDELALDVVGQVIGKIDVRTFIAAYEASRRGTAAKTKAKTTKPTSKSTSKSMTKMTRQ
jgi:hypothetical protein